jgi:hypothetical protein
MPGRNTRMKSKLNRILRRYEKGAAGSSGAFFGAFRRFVFKE